MSETVPTRIIPTADVRKWTELGWMFSSPAFTPRHSVLVWLRDDKPREPRS